MNTNAYSRTWFELFLETRPFTQSEIGFITRHLPNPPYHKILDVCCGQGRHTNLLGKQGYELVGIDIDEPALSIARQTAPQTVQYVHQDMRRIAEVDGLFDGVILMWQSFGYFDEATNESIIAQVSEKLRGGGRFILDIYNRNFWEMNQGTKRFERNGLSITAVNKMEENRLICDLDYGSAHDGDRFDWQLYTLDEIVELASKYRLTYLLSGVESDEKKVVDDQSQQIQIVFEKAG